MVDETATESNLDLTEFFKTEELFDSLNEVKQWCQYVGRRHNTVVVTRSSKEKPGGYGSRLILWCEQGGTYRGAKAESKSTNEMERDYGSKKSGCPFRLNCAWVEGDKWRVIVGCGVHNHKIASSLHGHAYVGRLTDEEKEHIFGLVRSGVQTAAILTSIKSKFPDNLLTKRTLSNQVQALRFQQREGRTTM